MFFAESSRAYGQVVQYRYTYAVVVLRQKAYAVVADEENRFKS